MNIKKLVSAVVASAMALTSALTLAVSSGADAVMQPLKEISATARLDGYTKTQLENFPLQTLLDNMKYGNDVYEEVPVEDKSSESSVSETNGTETEAAAQAETQRVKVHSAGDPIEFAENAKYVWVGDEEYSILDGSATVNLSQKYSDDDYYTLSEKIIVGSAKQLSLTDIIYNAYITVNKAAVDYGIKFYYLNGGKKVYIDDAKETSYSNSFVEYSTAQSVDEDKEIYIEASPTIRGSNNEELDITIEYGGTNSKDPQIMRRYSSEAYIDFTIRAVDKNDKTNVVYDEEIGIRLNWQSMYFFVNLKNDANNYGHRYNLSSLNTPFKTDENINIRDNPVDAEYNLVLEMESHSDWTDISTGVTKAVAGSFNSSAAAANAKDIKNDLFGTGYKANFKDGQTFTLFLDSSMKDYFKSKTEKEYVMQITVKAVGNSSSTESNPNDEIASDFKNEYFKLNGIRDENDGYVPYWLFASSNKTAYDTYYKSHYQLALVYDDNDSFDISKTKLQVSSTHGANVYNVGSQEVIDFGNDVQDFTNGTVQYTVAANGGQGNYFVTVKRNSVSGPELFVNGPTGDKEREVYFDHAYGEYHDIIIANLGNEDLKNLKVTLSNAANVRLDDYWKLDGDADASTLGAFTSTYDTGNLAKIRLRPITDENGEIKSGEVSGVLTITADGQDTVTVKLKGHAGNPQIVTDSNLKDPVKYVPYAAIITTDNIHEWNKVSYDLHGTLPEGMTFDSATGEIYGTPQDVGEFKFTVEADFSYSDFRTVSKVFSLRVTENTDENVYKASDEDYSIETPVGTRSGDFTYTITADEAKEEQIFTSNGEITEFMGFWLNGKKLTPETDYDAEPGSTKITIKAQTMSTLADKSTNTIAAEFRVDGKLENELKRTAQNFTIGENKKPDTPGSSGGSGNTGNTGNTGNSGNTNGSENSGTPGSNNPGSSDNSQTNNNDIVFTPADPDNASKGATVTAPENGGNPQTGIAVSSAGLLLSALTLTVILFRKKKKH